jgi:hypothetical protein
VRFDRAFAGSDPAGRRAKDLRPDTGTGVVAFGTLACPDCDAPTSPGPTSLAPTDVLHCPICWRAGPVRDFLSLARPTRPARVQVRLSLRAPRPRS